MTAETISGQTAISGRRWAESRRGFQHQVALELGKKGFSSRKATRAVQAFFAALKNLLVAGDQQVALPFGTLKVVDNPEFNERIVRFGKVIVQKRQKRITLAPTPPPPKLKGKRTDKYGGVYCECREFWAVVHVTARGKCLPIVQMPSRIRCRCGRLVVIDRRSVLEYVRAPTAL
jgi:nucleoid DNA-binding protein